MKSARGATGKSKGYFRQRRPHEGKRDLSSFLGQHISDLAQGVSVKKGVAAEKAGDLSIDQAMKDHVYLLRHLDFIQNVMKHL